MIFSQEDEAKFDQELTIIIIESKNELSDNCKNFDESNIGIIKLSQFKEALDACNIKLKSDV